MAYPGRQHLRLFQPGDGDLITRKLYIDRHGCAHAVDINLMRVQAFRFQEELVGSSYPET